LGVVAAFVDRRRMGVDREYLAFAVSSGLLALLIVALPVLQTTWNVSRLHHLTLIILAPFCVLGIMALFRLPGLIKKTDKTSCPHERKAYVVASVFLVLLLLFNTGFMSALAREPMLSPSLFHEDLPLFVHGGDLAGAKWLGTASRQDSVYADYYSLSILLAYSNTSIEKIQSLTPKTKITTESEIFVRAGDVALIESGGKNEQLLGPSGGILSSSFTGNLSKIYDSGSVIYSD
jgi:Predicted membrane protein